MGKENLTIVRQYYEHYEPDPNLVTVTVWSDGSRTESTSCVGKGGRVFWRSDKVDAEGKYSYDQGFIDEPKLWENFIGRAELSFDNIWGLLGEHEQEAFKLLSVSDWRTGMDMDILKAMGVHRSTLETLIERGMVESQPSWLLMQIQADLLRDQANEIREKISTDKSADDITEEERRVLDDFNRYESSAKQKSETAMYRIKNKNFADYIDIIEDPK